MIVYYSNKGVTKLHADILSVFVHQSVYEIKEQTERSMDIIGMGKTALESVFNIPANLSDLPDISKERVIYICSPVWAGNVATPVKAFIKKAGLSQKKVNMILTCTNPIQQEEYKKRAMVLLNNEKCRIGFVKVCVYERGKMPDTDLIRKRLAKLVLNVDQIK